MVDVRKLYGQTGMFTYDPGFTSTASCSSKITFIDGDEGILLHRGYTIEDLAKNSSFLEVAYLILNGELPNKAELDEFVQGVTYHTMMHEQIQFLFRGFRRDAHPMAVMIGVVGALSAFYYEDLRTDDPFHRHIASFRLIAKIPTIAAMCHKYSIGQPFVYPRNDMSYAENFLHMMFAVPCEPYKVNPALARRSTASSSCTPITSRTPRPRPFGWWAQPAPHPMPRSRPASPRFGVRPMAAPTRPWSRCWRRSAVSTAFRSSSRK